MTCTRGPAGSLSQTKTILGRNYLMADTARSDLRRMIQPRPDAEHQRIGISRILVALGPGRAAEGDTATSAARTRLRSRSRRSAATARRSCDRNGRMDWRKSPTPGAANWRTANRAGRDEYPRSNSAHAPARQPESRRIWRCGCSCPAAMVMLKANSPQDITD
jgi:hypothetical protein